MTGDPIKRELLRHFAENAAPQELSTLKLAAHLQLSLGELTQLADLPPEALQVGPRKSQTQERLRDILRVLSTAAEVFASEQIAARWLVTEPIAAFHGQAAISLIARGRAEDVIQYLQSIA